MNKMSFLQQKLSPLNGIRSGRRWQVNHNHKSIPLQGL